MIEASWQPDPDDGQRLRWWDGSQWTEHVAPGPGGEEVGSAPMRTTADPPASPGLAPATTEDATAATGDAATSAQPDTEATDGPGGVQPGPEGAGTPGTSDDTSDGTTDRPPADGERAETSPVWTADAATGTPEDAAAARPPAATDPAGATGQEGGTEAWPRGEQPAAGVASAPTAARAPTPSTGAGPVWGVGAATAADDRSKRPFVTARAVHRIIAAIGVVMLTVASIQMITLRSVSGDSVAEAFYNAVGWGLLGATIWGVCVYSMREIDAERAAARDQAVADAPGTGRRS